MTIFIYKRLTVVVATQPGVAQTHGELYNMRMTTMSKYLKLFIFATLILFVTGCVSTIQPVAESFPKSGTVAFGRIQVVLTGPTSRWYEPHVIFIELRNRTIDERVRIDVQSAESLLVFSLPEGDYEFTRVQIGEGPFRAMANMTTAFHIQAHTVNYVGTWKFSVDPPYYNRDIMMTVSSELVETLAEAYVTYPDLDTSHLTNNLPTPAKIQTRLFEISPYPLVRWFQRHHTS